MSVAGRDVKMSAEPVEQQAVQVADIDAVFLPQIYDIDGGEGPTGRCQQEQGEP
jgi:hypothetical protein